MSIITDLIARHHPDRDGAIALINAVEVVIGMAESYLEDLQTGIEQGIYDEKDDVKMYVRVLELIERD